MYSIIHNQAGNMLKICVIWIYIQLLVCPFSLNPFFWKKKHLINIFLSSPTARMGKWILTLSRLGYFRLIYICRFGWGGSQDIMRKQCCNSHVFGPTFWARSNGKGFKSLHPETSTRASRRLHVSRFRAWHGAPPTLKPNWNPPRSPTGMGLQQK